MRLDRAFRRTELVGNLLVELAPRAQRKNLGLARRQRRQARMQGAEPFALFARRPETGECALYGRQQNVLRCRFGQEVLGTSLDGAYARGDVRVAGQENDRKRVSERGER